MLPLVESFGVRAFLSIVLVAALIGIPPIGHAGTFGAKARNVRPGVLQLEFVTGNSRGKTPVRVRISNQRGENYIAQNSLLIGGHCFLTDEPLTPETAKATQRRWINNSFTGNFEFYSKGSARTILPPGIYTVKVFKGLEFTVQERRYVIGSGKTTRASIRMKRWIDMPDSGWVGSDGHLHIARPHKASDLPLAHWMKAEDIHVANLLQWGTFQSFFNSTQYAFGDEGTHHEGQYLLVAGQENPRTHFLGHAVVLGAKQPIHFPDAYLDFRSFFERARILGGVSGYAHYAEAFEAQRGLALDLAHDVVDFIEVLQIGLGRYDTWYEALNLGFRIAPSAGTDYPCSPHPPGTERFYTKIEGGLTRESWLNGVRNRRTFVTNGPMLRFSIDGHDIGEAFSLGTEQIVTITGEVHFDPLQDDVSALDLIRNGKVAQTFRRKGDSSEITFATEFTVAEASWFAVRARGRKLHQIGNPGFGMRVHAMEFPDGIPAEAHSAPIFVDIEGRPRIVESEISQAILQTWIDRLESLEEDVKQEGLEKIGSNFERVHGVTREYIKAHRAALLKSIQQTKTIYSAMKK